MMVGVVGSVAAKHAFQGFAYGLAVACLYVGEETVESPRGTYDTGFFVVGTGIEGGGCGVYGKPVSGAVVETKSCDVAQAAVVERALGIETVKPLLGNFSFGEWIDVCKIVHCFGVFGVDVAFLLTGDVFDGEGIG